jgi:hypothetical protein
MLKRDINLLLLLFATILIALGALGVVGKADFAIGKQAGLQISTSPGFKIDGPAPQAQ